ncbi:MAG: DNA-directed RNA polymerase subunit H [Nitrososphaerota archaeon]
MSKKTKAGTQAFDIAEHSLVPKHELLSNEEAEELLKRLDVTRQQLPYILSTDPMVKKLGAKVGDIIRIKRVSETAGEAVYYRVVWRES